MVVMGGASALIVMKHFGGASLQHKRPVVSEFVAFASKLNSDIGSCLAPGAVSRLEKCEVSACRTTTETLGGTHKMAGGLYFEGSVFQDECLQWKLRLSRYIKVIKQIWYDHWMHQILRKRWSVSLPKPKLYLLSTSLNFILG